MGRIISWYSCGAASTVATMLMLKEAPETIPVYTKVIEEHQDNDRYLKDCEQWFGKQIVILQDEKYGGSIYKVFEELKFIKAPFGAPCTTILKKQLRKDFQLPGDTHIFGFTVEERHRAERFKAQNPDLKVRFPLIERDLDKNDCLSLIKDSGINLPAMYEMGYLNNNCIGCVKGGAGYWNKIRIDYPEVFHRMAALERDFGYALLKLKDKPCYLDELPPHAGRYEMEPSMSCGLMCSLVADELLT